MSVLAVTGIGVGSSPSCPVNVIVAAGIPEPVSVFNVPDNTPGDALSESQSV
jgi:hypothetical protein